MRKMSAEFDGSRFNAVDKFFENVTLPTPYRKKSTGSSTEDSKGKGRVGVGAGPNKNDNATTKYQLHNLLARQALNVGRKRSRENSTEISSKEYDVDGFSIHGSHDVDQMADGRTSLETNLGKNIDNQVNNTNQKKKIGKKERERQSTGVSIERIEADAKRGRERAGEIAITVTNKEDDSKRTGPTENKGKRRRRKVRSRQKNIKKDFRSVDEKPAYLVPGNSNYQGRPMTQATRKKLGLPDNRDRWKSKKPEAHKSSLFVIDQSKDFSGDVAGSKLAIDEFMNGIEIDQSDKSTAFKNTNVKITVRQKSNSSRKEKKRFRNLV